MKTLRRATPLLLFLYCCLGNWHALFDYPVNMGVCSVMKAPIAIIMVSIFLKTTGILAETCGVAEEGKAFNISYMRRNLGAGSLCGFGHVAGDSLFVLARCMSAGCSSTDPSKYLIYNISNVYILTVINISRVDLKPFIFYADGNALWTCDLTVYARPESPTCDPPSYRPGKNVDVRCSTTKSYPEATCVVKLQGQQSELPGVIYSHSNASSDGVQYYSTTCELTYTVSGPGSYSFDVDMFVIINNTHYGIVSTSTGLLDLTLPTVNSSLDCPKGDEVKDGYIKTGSAATCTCRRGDPGNPEGRVRWYDSSGLVVSTPDTDGGSSTLTLTQTDADNYSCKADSDLGIQTQVVTYTPTFAFGPTLLGIRKEPNDPIDLCPGSIPTVTVHCSVPVSNVNPYPVFAVYSNSQDLPTTWNNGTKNRQVYSYTDTVTVTPGGNHNIKCVAKNGKFDDITSTNELLLEVRVPPSSRPVTEIQDKNYEDTSSGTLTVEENSTISVICQTHGGYPAVSNVNLTCGTVMSLPQGNKAVLYFLATSDMTVLTCSCTAYHVTNCYVNNTSSVTVPIHPTFAKDEKLCRVGDEVNAGAIAGGVIAAILFILVIILAVYFLRRHGILNSSEKRESVQAELQPSQSFGKGGPSYENTLPAQTSRDSPDFSMNATLNSSDETDEQGYHRPLDIQMDSVVYENSLDSV